MLATRPRSSALTPAASSGRRSMTALGGPRVRRPSPGCPKLASGPSRPRRPSTTWLRRPECPTYAGDSSRPGRRCVVDPGLDPETGFQYDQARYYDPQTGQFVSRDPLFAITRDPYAYVGSDFLNATDPTGLCADPSGTLCTIGDAVNSGLVALGNAIAGGAAGATGGTSTGALMTFGGGSRRSLQALDDVDSHWASRRTSRVVDRCHGECAQSLGCGGAGR